MSEIRFYHLQRARLEGILPVMLERVYERGERALVLLGSSERAVAMSAHLWTYRPDSFLPHGVKRDGNLEAQPIYLSESADNLNKADILFLCDNAEPPACDPYRLVCLIFDGNDEESLAAARGHWRRWQQEAQHRLLYYQQDEAGKWRERGAA